MSSPTPVHQCRCQPYWIVELLPEGDTFLCQLDRPRLIILQTDQPGVLTQCLGPRGLQGLLAYVRRRLPLIFTGYLQGRLQPVARFWQVALPLPITPDCCGQAQTEFTGKPSRLGNVL